MTQALQRPCFFNLLPYSLNSLWRVSSSFYPLTVAVYDTSLAVLTPPTECSHAALFYSIGPSLTFLHSHARIYLLTFIYLRLFPRVWLLAFTWLHLYSCSPASSCFLSHILAIKCTLTHTFTHIILLSHTCLYVHECTQYPYKAINLQCKVMWRTSGGQTEAGWKAEWQPSMMAVVDKQKPANESLSEYHHPLSQSNYWTEW